MDVMRVRKRIKIRGAVQGVGFRPFVYRLATSLNISGWVLNSPMGVLLEVESDVAVIDEFIRRLEFDKPRISIIHEIEISDVPPTDSSSFTIKESIGGKAEAFILPEIATCPDCMSEVNDPNNRRYRYPFTNCTNCGPRYSIIETLPYDRVHTTMRMFEMCPACRGEYEDPGDRRFHAQPNACSECGPHLELWDSSGCISRIDVLLEAAKAIQNGNIVAVKGLGGFHLMADALSDTAVKKLRERKQRQTKPLAMMFPNISSIRNYCEVSSDEENLLKSPASPIVLLKKRMGEKKKPLSEYIAPQNPYLGVMLPYTPLHHLLLKELGTPVIATSGNLSDEPICTDEFEALERLSGLADVFLIHNRPIRRHVDDSIARIVDGQVLILRRARGYAPLPIATPFELKEIVAGGAHLKNTVAVSLGENIFISQHIGDLETPQAVKAFDEVMGSLGKLYDAKPEVAVCDLHPDYISTARMVASGIPLVRVQHHLAHIYSCMLDNGIEGSVLGISWDGTGYGGDGTIWGGEFITTGKNGAVRRAHIRTFPLPGGGSAVKEPRRAALGILSELSDDPLSEFSGLPTIEAFESAERSTLMKMIEKGVNSPYTSSAGRLFDAVASMLDICQKIEFEGQAAIALEHAAVRARADSGSYHIEIENIGGIKALNWEPMIREILTDIRNEVSTSIISRRFHNSLIESIIEVARIIDEKRVVLTGGCFQNMLLLEGAYKELKENGFEPFRHRLIPPNDGGIAAGQIYAVACGATMKTGE